jgi:hypothetical protein
MVRCIKSNLSDPQILFFLYADPDHGYFAHSSSGSMALAFDWYASDGTDNMIHIQEELSDT